MILGDLLPLRIRDMALVLVYLVSLSCSGSDDFLVARA